MPIEIKELTIRIHVADQGGGQTAGQPSQQAEEVQKIKAEVMEDVMEVMKRLKER
ncbi:hypothetical protein ADIS_1415 [Lunatimonas lonarensis]|uniref:Uncharacterized protein n=1 Tax=Lunatimonas lonarensis TaxID=1232681 RepID=R7ZW30_9BACT|nr:DUF5908 family protein [Lunatimonas lonarensis]EON78218.1 hypothetical protein ADIS_1415 [Lunatimonas lonarensis]